MWIKEKKNQRSSTLRTDLTKVKLNVCVCFFFYILLSLPSKGCVFLNNRLPLSYPKSWFVCGKMRSKREVKNVREKTCCRRRFMVPPKLCFSTGCRQALLGHSSLSFSRSVLFPPLLRSSGVYRSYCVSWLGAGICWGLGESPLGWRENQPRFSLTSFSFIKAQSGR